MSDPNSTIPPWRLPPSDPIEVPTHFKPWRTLPRPIELWIVMKRSKSALEPYWESSSSLQIFISQQEATDWIVTQPGPSLPIRLTFEPPLAAESEDSWHWRVMKVQTGVEIDLRK